MLQAYEGAGGDIADCMMAALRAGEGEAGDMRGRQSAALVVVPADGDPWARRFDLRVDDHPEPVDELDRLLTLGRAFEHFDKGSTLAGSFALEEGLAELDRAVQLAPDDDQLAFWRAAMLAGNARLDDARAELDRIREVEPRWGPYLWRCAAAGLFPNDASVLEALAPIDPKDRP
jgi:hypothetical protein